MSWLSRFKSKKTKCLMCEKSAGKNPVEVHYRYDTGEGKIGTAHICEACAKKIEQHQKEQDDVESL